MCLYYSRLVVAALAMIAIVGPASAQKKLGYFEVGGDPANPNAAGATDSATLSVQTPQPANRAKPVSRMLPPDPEAQRNAQRVIDQLFRTEYRDPRPAARLALSEKLLRQAIPPRDDPGARYVLFSEAR